MANENRRGGRTAREQAATEALAEVTEAEAAERSDGTPAGSTEGPVTPGEAPLPDPDDVPATRKRKAVERPAPDEAGFPAEVHTTHSHEMYGQPPHVVAGALALLTDDGSGMHNKSAVDNAIQQFLGEPVYNDGDPRPDDETSA